jgi:hypothetical protein
VLLGLYLVGTWMLGMMPASYYRFEGGINWIQVFNQLLLQDGMQCVMHILEHEIDSIMGTKVINVERLLLYQKFMQIKQNISVLIFIDSAPNTLLMLLSLSLSECHFFKLILFLFLS